MYSGKYNYTLFHFSDVYIRYKKSKPLYVQHSCLDIYDINAKLMVEKPSISSLMDEPKHIEDILSRDICKWKERDDKR